MSKRAKRNSKSPGKRPSARPTVPAPDLDPVLSIHPDTADIDDLWEDEVVAPPPPRRPRELMPTLHDEDPLRHDVVDEPREEESSRPTLLDVDPLRHDVEPGD